MDASAGVSVLPFAQMPKIEAASVAITNQCTPCKGIVVVIVCSTNLYIAFICWSQRLRPLIHHMQALMQPLHQQEHLQQTSLLSLYTTPSAQYAQAFNWAHFKAWHLWFG